ncbi:ferric reductase [Rhodoferax lacus]|uniref:Ferric reductase n=1 Tax=Rhodoferax lacus TaxID=2184758 RepID=A0A3E1R5S4_9BURK|nr:ferric reductase-like transmembrane domain-containing protein [Rhodoferax lacus]RFO94706.1 ferric reductase [Rhodoferax lacus]
MKPVQRLFWVFLFALTLLWWASDSTAAASLVNLFAWRNLLLQYSGVLSIGVMSVSMLLAVRPVVLEPRLGGLDKMYRLHKWLGISALVTAISHWLIAQGPKWMVDWGWLERPVRGPRPPPPEELIHRLIASQHGLAESVGEWAFYLAVALMVIALVKAFPYKAFLKTHTILAATYLALVFHAVVLLNWGYWTSPLGLPMALLMGAGTVSAVLVLLGRVARNRKVDGTVVGVHHHALLKTMSIDIQLQGPWAGHKAGQFAFVTLHADEGAHPYTISSAWLNDGRITFIIKALGDYTGTLSQRVQVGETVRLEGPYGRFTFEGSKKRQIWIGGGIGITPFVARMKALAHTPDERTVDLFHTTAAYDPHAIGLMTQDAQNAGVHLHVLWDPRDGRLDANHIVAKVPDWKNADVWFCGPAKFGQSLRRALVAMGMDGKSFHQELFEMR